MNRVSRFTYLFSRYSSSSSSSSSSASSANNWSYLMRFRSGAVQGGGGGSFLGYDPTFSSMVRDRDQSGIHWGVPLLPPGVEMTPENLASVKSCTVVPDEMSPLNTEAASVDNEGTLVLSVSEVLAPCSWPPPTIWAVGLNYVQHAKEIDHEIPKFPVFFLKSATSIQRPHGSIRIPKLAQKAPEVDYEGELAVVVGHRVCRDVSPEEALDYVAGYTIANDVTARRWQGPKGSNQWSRSKSFDTFCPLGPLLVSSSVVPDPQALTIRTRVNGELVQESSTSDMIFSVAELISALSSDISLLPGTVLLTGTPAGVGYVSDRYLAEGDEISVSIDSLGELKNTVKNKK